MKIVITGHTSGLGKAIYDHFSKAGHEVTGLSRSTGHDLSTLTDDILSIAGSADLFFNNAYVGHTQSVLLKSLYNTVRTVTSGSMGADHAHLVNKYYRDKRLLELTFDHLKKKEHKSMLMLKMGYLENHADKKFITYDVILSAVDFWIENPRITIIEFENIT